jgi:hypothetical protein
MFLSLQGPPVPQLTVANTVGMVIMGVVVVGIAIVTLASLFRWNFESRREKLLAKLGREYTLAHGDTTCAVSAGVELPPKEWINRRLQEIGENWQV